MYRMEKFSDFIVEQKEESYKLIVFNNSNEEVRDVGKRTRPDFKLYLDCLLYTSPSPRDTNPSRMPSSA